MFNNEKSRTLFEVRLKETAEPCVSPMLSQDLPYLAWFSPYPALESPQLESLSWAKALLSGIRES